MPLLPRIVHLHSARSPTSFFRVSLGVPFYTPYATHKIQHSSHIQGSCRVRPQLPASYQTLGLYKEPFYQASFIEVFSMPIQPFHTDRSTPALQAQTSKHILSTITVPSVYATSFHPYQFQYLSLPIYPVFCSNLLCLFRIYN